MKYVVLISNNEGGGAFICDTLDAAKAKAREWVDEGDPGLDDEERETFERELAQVTGEYVDAVSGSQTWKETIYIGPVTVTHGSD